MVIADDGTWADDVGSLTAHCTAGNDYIFKDDAKVTFGNPVQQAILDIGIDSLTIYGEAGNDTITISSTSGNGVTVDGGLRHGHRIDA